MKKYIHTNLLAFSRRACLTIAALSALAPITSAQVLFDGSATSGIIQNSTTGSVNTVNVGAGANLLIAVVQGTGGSAVPSITSVTYNGGTQSMTNLASGSSSDTDVFNSIWYLPNPTSATSTDVSFTASTGTNTNYWVSVYSLSNADTNTANWFVSTNTGNTGSTGSTNETLSASLSGVPTGSFVFDAFAASQGNGTNISGATRSGTVIQEEWNTSSPNNSRASIFGTYITDASGNLTLTGQLNRLFSSEPSAISSIGIAAIPEPSTAVLLLGTAGLSLMMSRRRRA